MIATIAATYLAFAALVIALAVVATLGISLRDARLRAAAAEKQLNDNEAAYAVARVRGSLPRIGGAAGKPQLGRSPEASRLVVWRNGDLKMKRWNATAIAIGVVSMFANLIVLMISVKIFTELIKRDVLKGVAK